MDITEEAFMNALQDACRAGIESEQARIVAELDQLLVSLHGAYPTDYALVATMRQLIKGKAE